MKRLILWAFLSLATASFGQGLIHDLNKQNANSDGEPAPLAQCGSFFLMQDADRARPGYLKAADQAMRNLVKKANIRQKSSSVLTIPVVFHVVYNDSTENIPDSVIQNQLVILNESFRRQNADTGTLRSSFLPYVADARIEFELARTAPDGSPTTGITRTATAVKHFGGILPYGQNQTAQIQQWVTDSLFYNLYRITNSNLGGISAWDTARYLNIWIGDLRVFEPKINNFEELIFLGLASPPYNHPNFMGTGFDTLAFEQGVLMHYVTIGSNNPNTYPAPYGLFNSRLDDGGITVHEVGHFLGLRHIWGDGGCTADDFIGDTPLSNASGQFGCNKNRNSCLDSIGGLDLPDMAENYMDYSSDACMNSFTRDQVQVMRQALLNLRPDLYSLSQQGWPSRAGKITGFPNPTRGTVRLQADQIYQELTLRIYNPQGKLMQQLRSSGQETIEIKLEGPAGLYLIQARTDQQSYSLKVLKQP